MGQIVKGDVVVIPFPFSDLTQSKRRPSLVLATLEGEDLILCQITSQATTDRHAVAIEDSDFESGGLKLASYVRPLRIFTADRKIVLYKIGHLKRAKLLEVVDKVVHVLRK